MSTMKVNRIENTSTTDGGIDINTSGNVGIGTSSPSSNLDVEAATGDATLRIHAAENNSGSEPTLILESSNDFAESVIDFKDSSGTAGGVRYNHGDNALRFLGKGINGEAMRIDSSGNVGIGTTAIDFGAFGSNTGGVAIEDIGGTNTGLKIGDGSNDNYLIAAGNGSFYQSHYGSGSMIFGVGNGTGTERMRIDSSGRVLVGTTNASGLPSTGGLKIRSNAVGSTSQVALVLEGTGGDFYATRWSNTGMSTLSISSSTPRLTYLSASGSSILNLFDSGLVSLPPTYNNSVTGRDRSRIRNLTFSDFINENRIGRISVIIIKTKEDRML